MKNLPFLLAAFLLSNLNFLNAQCMLYEVGLDERIEMSESVFEGKVIEKRSFWNDDETNIFTANKVEIYRLFKGEATSGIIEILTRGGEVGLEKQTDYPSLQFEIGDVGVFLAKPNQERILENSTPNVPIFQPSAGPQGFVKYESHTGKAHDSFQSYDDIELDLYKVIESFVGETSVVVNHFKLSDWIKEESTSRVVTITSFSPTTVTAGTDTELTITGSGFGASQGNGFVGFSNADDGGSTYTLPVEGEYVSWSDTEIRVMVPTDAGNGNIAVMPDGGSQMVSATSLSVTYAQLNAVSNASGTTDAYETQHVNRNGNGGYIWQMYTGFASSSAAAPFLRSLQTWCNATGVYWTIGANTSTNVVANDDINIVRFDVGGELPSGVLGRCNSYFSGCFTGSSPALAWYVEELDIVFNDVIPGSSWNYGPGATSFSQFDFESVSLHELGHGHQLGHVISPSDVMHFSISNGSDKRVLSANEIAGGADVYSRSTTSAVCGQSLMSTGIDCSSLALPVELVSFTARKQIDEVRLDWQTSSEVNNDYFELEHSVDGRVFTPIGKLKGAGHSHILNTYHFIDPTPEKGLNYYRLRQVDYDGSFEYSDTRSVIFDSGNIGFTVYPNPFKNDVLTIALESPSESEANFQLIDVSGKTQYNQVVQFSEGQNKWEINVDDLPSGVYWLRINSRGESYVERLVKL